ncbi:MAG TPA: nitroreductase family protein [Gaiellaceae bacterium]|jgi:nitroreductase
METLLAIVSRRETRDFADRDIAPELAERILDAGRVAGSASNRQPLRYVVVEDDEVRARLAETVFVPGNVSGAKLLVGLVAIESRWADFDAGRAVENMFLAAWDAGIGSVPNGLKDSETAGRLVRIGEGERLLTLLSFGYPARVVDPAARAPEDWSARANRKPLGELVTRI